MLCRNAVIPSEPLGLWLAATKDTTDIQRAAIHGLATTLYENNRNLDDEQRLDIAATLTTQLCEAENLQIFPADDRDEPLRRKNIYVFAPKASAQPV
jgi:hypothetical protein